MRQKVRDNFNAAIWRVTMGDMACPGDPLYPAIRPEVCNCIGHRWNEHRVAITPNYLDRYFRKLYACFRTKRRSNRRVDQRHIERRCTVPG